MLRPGVDPDTLAPLAIMSPCRTTLNAVSNQEPSSAHWSLSLWFGVCAALVSACGSSPTQPATSSAVSSVLTSSVTTTSVALTSTSAHYAGTLTQTPPLPPVPLDLSLFFTIPGGSLRPASAARPIHGLAINFLVTGGYDTGPGGFSGTIAGTLDGTPANGTFTGTLTANLATGCVAKRNYQGPLTAAALNWAPGDQIETCGGASPLTFTVAPPATATPPTTSVPTTSTIPGCTYTLSIAPTIDGYPTGGTFSATVTTAAGCTWTAVSNAPWIHVTAGSAGSGTGTVTFAADANASPARIGTLTIAGQIITFNQSTTTTAHHDHDSDDVHHDDNLDVHDAYDDSDHDADDRAGDRHDQWNGEGRNRRGVA